MQENLHALKSDAGTASIKPARNIGGTVYYGASQALSTGTGWYGAAREINPATSAAWTVSDVNAVEGGAEVA